MGFIVSVFVFAKIGHPIDGKHKDLFDDDLGGRVKTYGELWLYSFLASSIWPIFCLIHIIEGTPEIKPKQELKDK